MISYCVVLLVRADDRFLAIKKLGKDYWQLPAYVDRAIRGTGTYDLGAFHKMLEELLGEAITAKLTRSTPEQLERRGKDVPETTLFPYRISEELSKWIADYFVGSDTADGFISYDWLDSDQASKLNWWDKQRFLWDENQDSTDSVNNDPIDSSEEWEEYSLLDIRALIGKNEVQKAIELVRLWTDSEKNSIASKNVKPTIVILEWINQIIRQKSNTFQLDAEEEKRFNNRIVDSLLDLCENLERKYQLEILSIDKGAKQSLIEFYITNGQFEDALNELEIRLPITCHKEIFLLRGRISSVKENDLKGIESIDNIVRELSKIIGSILGLNDH